MEKEVVEKLKKIRSKHILNDPADVRSALNLTPNC